MTTNTPSEQPAIPAWLDRETVARTIYAASGAKMGWDQDADQELCFRVADAILALRPVDLPAIPASAGGAGAWRDGFQAARECLSEENAFCLTEDVEDDAWLDSKTRKALPVEQPAQTSEVERLRAHIAEQITHIETRIQDGKEMGAAVWRIALEDIVRENRAALNPSQERAEAGN